MERCTIFLRIASLDIVKMSILFKLIYIDSMQSQAKPQQDFFLEKLTLILKFIVKYDEYRLYNFEK